MRNRKDGETRTIGTQQLDFLGNFQCRLNFLDNMHREKQGLKYYPHIF